MDNIVKNGRHAYLIMAHHRPDLLKRLISALDDKRNDIFLHIDLKSDMKPKEFKTKNAGIYFVKQMDVHWAGYSQVECEYRLLKAAVNNSKYDYYHLLTGASYPLWNQDYLHQFFDDHAGINFVGFDNKNDFSERARYYFFASEYGKPKGIKGSIVYRIRTLLLAIQKILKYDRTRKFNNLSIKKGLAYWSVTQEAAEYILNKETFIKELLRYSVSGDEIFVQTLLYNSELRNTIFCSDKETSGASRLSAWESSINKEREGYNFMMEDIDFILASDCCFAFKFESDDGIKLIDIIDKERNINYDFQEEYYS